MAVGVGAEGAEAADPAVHPVSRRAAHGGGSPHRDADGRADRRDRRPQGGGYGAVWVGRRARAAAGQPAVHLGGELRDLYPGQPHGRTALPGAGRPMADADHGCMGARAEARRGDQHRSAGGTYDGGEVGEGVRGAGQPAEGSAAVSGARGHQGSAGVRARVPGHRSSPRSAAFLSLRGTSCTTPSTVTGTSCAGVAFHWARRDLVLAREVFRFGTATGQPRVRVP